PSAMPASRLKVPASVLIRRLDQAELHEAYGEDQRREDPGDRACVPEVQEVERLVVHVAEEHLGLMQRTAAGHYVELDEALERPDREHHGDEQRRRLEQRHGDEPGDLSTVGTIYTRGFG